MSSLPSVKTGLLCNKLDDQVLVYDTVADTVHLLDPVTARVMDLLQDGERTVEEVTAELNVGTDESSNKALLELALEELRKANLLDETTGPLPPQVEISRRNLLRKVALAGAAAVLAPAIISLSPSPAHAQTSCLAKTACCTVDADCCSRKCDASTNPANGGCATGPKECH